MLQQAMGYMAATHYNVKMARADINGIYSGKCKLIETVQYVDQVDL